MDKSKIMDIIAYYLSEYDMQAFHELGFNTQSQGFAHISQLFEKKDSYLRRLRDEFDVVTSNPRKGQRNRPPRQRVIRTAEHLSSFSFNELTEMVCALILNISSTNEFSEENNNIYELSNLSEDEIEYIINFKDPDADVKTIRSNSVKRVYNTSIIRQLKRLYQGKCQICGQKPFDYSNTDICEVHHIAYFASFHNNNANNLIVLCPNHHRLIHRLNPIYDSQNNSFIFPDGRELKILLDYHLNGEKKHG